MRIFIIIPTYNERANLPELVKQIFNLKTLLAFIISTWILGQVTFYFLGVDFPTRALCLVVHMIIIPLVFISLGIFIHIGIGIWRSVYSLGNTDLQINVFHPDKFGGTKSIGDLIVRVNYFGSALFIVYSFGALYSPYQNIALKSYSYFWIYFLDLPIE